MLVRLHFHSVLALSLNVLMAAASTPVRREAQRLLVISSQRQPGFRFADNVCFSEDRSNPAYRRTFRMWNIRHLLDVWSAHGVVLLSEWGSLRSYKVLWFRSCCLSFSLLVFPLPLVFFRSLAPFYSIWFALGGATFIGCCCCCCCLLAAPCWSLGVLRRCCCPLLIFLLLLFDLLDDFPDLPLCSLRRQEDLPELYLHSGASVTQ